MTTPVNYSPIIKIAKDLNVDTSSIAQDPKNFKNNVLEVARSALLALTKEKEMENTSLSVKIPTNQSIFDLGAMVSTGNNRTTVYLPSLYLVEREFVPFDGPDDPRLQDNEKLQEFANKLAERCGIEQKKVTWEDRMFLRMYLIAMKDPDKANEALSFILLHELGHVKKGHMTRTKEYKDKLLTPKYLILNIITLGIFKRAALDLQSRKHEAEADAFAYEHTGPTAEGGVYLFKTTSKFKPKGAIETLAYGIFTLSTLSSHGTESSRIKRITRYLKPLNTKI